jgi:hypothetical protein
MRPSLRLGGRASQEGSIIVIVMMFAMVFLIIGSALFVLLRSSNSATQLERKDVKAFNVAEAGIDAAMVALKASWPRASTQSVTVDPAEFRDLGFSDTQEFPESSHGQFIEAVTYDNSADNPTSNEDNRVFYDKNGDDIMWIDSEALVDNARHRILVLVERLKMPVAIPDLALVASTAGGNGQGLDIGVDPAYYNPPLINGSIPEGGADIWYTGKGTFNKDVSPGANIELITVPTSPFSEKVPDSLVALLKQMAQNAVPVSYFDDTNGKSAAASAFLCSSAGPGSVVYLKCNEDPITIAGNTAMGSPEKPVILVVDARNSSNPAIDWRGTCRFYGVVIVLGDVLLRGTMDIAGCVLCSGGVENKGGPGILYNGDYIRRVNEMHTLSVALVPNTWEEYTIAE